MDEWLPGGQESDPEMFPHGAGAGEDSGIDSDGERLHLLNMPHVGKQVGDIQQQGMDEWLPGGQESDPKMFPHGAAAGEDSGIDSDGEQLHLLNMPRVGEQVGDIQQQGGKDEWLPGGQESDPEMFPHGAGAGEDSGIDSDGERLDLLNMPRVGEQVGDIQQQGMDEWLPGGQESDPEMFPHGAAAGEGSGIGSDGERLHLLNMPRVGEQVGDIPNIQQQGGMDEWLPGGQESDPKMFPHGAAAGEDSGIDSDGERLHLLNMPHVGEQVGDIQQQGMDEWLPGGQESDPEMFPHGAAAGEDSGIGSDGERLHLLNMPRVGEQSDSSCEDTDGHRFDNRFGKQKFDALLSGSSDEYSPRHCSSLATFTKRPRKPDLEEHSEAGRDSPPLLEEELTASDEDDDGSVLELVIPMRQKTRYRGGTAELSYGGSFWRVVCCLPKLK